MIAFAEQKPAEDEKDDESEDEDSDSGPDVEDEKDMTEYVSQIGNIEERLKSHGMKYIKTTNDIRVLARTEEAYKKFAKDQGPSFPQHRRFCSVMDLRQAIDDEYANKAYNFFMFQPAEETDKVEKNASSLHFFNNGYSIIPDIKDKDPDDEDDKKLGTDKQGPQITVCCVGL